MLTPPPMLTGTPTVGHNVKWRKEVNPQVWEAETSFYFESL